MGINRRQWLKQSALLASLLNSGLLSARNRVSKLRIGACDWSLGKNSDPGSFDVAKSIGLQGVQLNLGSESNNMHLRESAVQQNFKQASKKTGVAIASLAIGELNKVPYKSDPKTEQWVWDSVDVAKAFEVKVILLAFFGKNDLRNDDAGKKEVIRRLKIVAPKAEKLGITLGIESYLSAEEHMEIIQQVGSKSVKVYYDFRNSADAGYDVIKEIQWLGKDMICELHMKENGHLLGKGTLDWQKICQTLLAMEYVGNGWMQIEGATPKDADVIESYKHNLDFLKHSFRY
ncbi:MAG TPA: sugar phosphate isomerase/epimerase family protein [Chryseolinea sp.]|nr:sugar phosphate isomerase/epimerase family protein [Chryseolinea sp.]